MRQDHRTLSVSGVRVHFSTAGDATAPGAILIHGWASSSRMWAPTIEHLQSRYRLVSLDLPGHGESDKPPAAWYSIEAFAGVVEDVARATEISSPLLFGHSLGGAIAIHLAVRSSLAPRALILINPLVSGPFRREWRLWLYRPALAVGRRLWPVASTWLDRSSNGSPGQKAGSTGRLRQRSDLARTTADSAIGSMKAALTCDLTEDLPHVACPSLWVIGTRDRTLPPAVGRAAAETMRDAQLIELKAGHHPYDRARKDYLAAVDRFLADKEPV